MPYHTYKQMTTGIYTLTTKISKTVGFYENEVLNN